jgi:hypothetical protein
MDGAKEKKQVHIWINAHTNGALHTIYKIKIEQKHSYRHAHTHIKRLFENKDQD